MHHVSCMGFGSDHSKTLVLHVAMPARFVRSALGALPRLSLLIEDERRGEVTFGIGHAGTPPSARSTSGLHGTLAIVG